MPVNTPALAARRLVWYLEQGKTPGQAAHECAVTLQSLRPYTDRITVRCQKFARLFAQHADPVTGEPLPGHTEWWNRNMTTIKNLAALAEE